MRLLRQTRKTYGLLGQGILNLTLKMTERTNPFGHFLSKKNDTVQMIFGFAKNLFLNYLNVIPIVCSSLRRILFTYPSSSSPVKA